VTTALLIALYVFFVLFGWYLILLACYLTLKYLRRERAWPELHIVLVAPVVLFALMLFWPFFYLALGGIWLSRRVAGSGAGLPVR
jgi:hypothetical protein